MKLIDLTFHKINPSINRLFVDHRHFHISISLLGIENCEGGPVWNHVYKKSCFSQSSWRKCCKKKMPTSADFLQTAIFPIGSNQCLGPIQTNCGQHCKRRREAENNRRTSLKYVNTKQKRVKVKSGPKQNDQQTNVKGWEKSLKTLKETYNGECENM